MNISIPSIADVDVVKFGTYSQKQIRQISCKAISSSLVLDNLGRPIKGGLYDPSLGPMSQGFMYFP